MASDISTIQSLKAVDAWIDVINANINGGVRTAFKASRLRFAGSNANVDRPGTNSSLPLQVPEPSLVTSNTVIDFSQGAVTQSTENSHLAIQGDGFFLLADPATIDVTTGATIANANARFLVTRDGEFHTNAQGLLVHSCGYFLVRHASLAVGTTRQLAYDTTTNFGTGSAIRAVFNNLDLSTVGAPTNAITLSDFVGFSSQTDIGGGAVVAPANKANVLITVPGGRQNLTFSTFGSTVFDLGFKATADFTVTANLPPHIRINAGNDSTNSLLNKSLEASNSSMTQSVPELSLAQKLFSALTKVFQTKQTNVDGVINLIR